MKYLKYKCLLAIILGCSLSGCFDLTEEVFDRVDSGVYYERNISDLKENE